MHEPFYKERNLAFTNGMSTVNCIKGYNTQTEAGKLIQFVLMENFMYFGKILK